MTISPSSARARLGQSWDATRQQQYRAQHPSLVFHFVVDASPSMIGDDARNLRRAFNQYLGWLQHHADPMSQAEVRCFSTALDSGRMQPLGQLLPLTEVTYNPKTHGYGTALYRAIGATCIESAHPGQHVLVVFTDGMDCTSGEVGWTRDAAATALSTHIQQDGWLAVFLGAFPEALDVGKALGFAPGNCLPFPSDKIPEAFQRLQEATQRYLAAAPAARKLLTAGGIF